MDKKTLPVFPTRVTQCTGVFGNNSAQVTELINQSVEAKGAYEFVIDQKDTNWAFFFQHINQVLQEIYPRITLINNMSWLNVLEPGASIEYHEHVNSPVDKNNFYLLTVVYYPNHTEEMGNLILYNPQVLDKLLGNQHTHEITIKSDSLLIMPSWLPHKTQPNNSNQKRISIAMEYSFG